MWSEEGKTKLPVLWEEGCDETHEERGSKYWELKDSCQDRGWKAGYSRLKTDPGDLLPVTSGECSKRPGSSVARKRAGRTLGEEVEKTSCWIHQGVEIPQHTVRKLNIIFTICPSVVGCRGFKGPKHLAAVGNHLMMLLWYLLLVISGSHSTGRQNGAMTRSKQVFSIVLLKYIFII